MELKPLKYKVKYEKMIASRIIVWLWSNIYKQCFDILNENIVENSEDVLRDAILQGKIFYQNNCFYSKTGRFNNEIARELEKIGAQYSKRRNAYVLPRADLSNDMIWAIDSIKAKEISKITALQEFLSQAVGNLTKSLKSLLFSDVVNDIMLDLQKRVYQNAKQHKIELITPKLDDFMADEIAKNYTENLDYWIENWLSDDIIAMRDVVGQMAIDGKSLIDIADYISHRFGVSQKKAKFLARNESAIATTSYLIAKYKKEGFTHYKWHTILDGRERELHKKLHGTIHSFDNPPIIDEKTGERGHPSQTYNCRCTLSPIANKEWLKNRKELYKKQQGLLGKIKGLFNA